MRSAAGLTKVNVKDAGSASHTIASLLFGRSRSNIEGVPHVGLSSAYLVPDSRALIGLSSGTLFRLVMTWRVALESRRTTVAW